MIVDCTDYGDSELFVVEGPTAASSLKPSRDRRYQAIFPMQGKIPNASSVSEKKLLQNPNVAGLLRSLHPDCIVEMRFLQFRYKRVILFGDPDMDGLHAVLLLVLFLTLYLPELIEQQRLYMLRSPLFGFYRDGECIALAYSIEHAEQVKSRFEPEAARIDMRRFKGIGSMEPVLLSQLIAADSGLRRQLSLSECEKMCASFFGN